MLWPGGVRAPGRSGRPEKPDLVALVTIEGEEVNLGYVHADANQFIRANTQAFDFVILNELLDDVACRAYYADVEGRPFEIVPLAREDGGRWTVRIDAAATGDLELPPESVTTTSAEGVELVTGAAARSARAGCSSCTTTASPTLSRRLPTTSRAPRRSPPSRTWSIRQGARRASRAASSASSGTRRSASSR